MNDIYQLNKSNNQYKCIYFNILNKLHMKKYKFEIWCWHLIIKLKKKKKKNKKKNKKINNKIKKKKKIKKIKKI